MSQTPVRKLAVVLHADVVGSTALVQRNETLAHQRIQDSFQRFSQIITTHGGIAHEVRGDALVAEFHKASDAVAAAVDFQTANASHNNSLGDDVLAIVRIGIAMGEVIVADGTITGEGIVLAQRLEQLSEPGGVCIQDAAYQTVPKRLSFRYENLGEQTLKGFTEPVRAYTVQSKTEEGVAQPEISQASGAAAELPDKPSIAVLPFTNMSADSEQEYFADGITEDIITALSRMSWFFVIGRNSTFTYKGKGMNAGQVARELGVQYVLEGSVRKAANRVRITAQLIDATTGNHLWAEHYDRDLSDIFAVQDEVTQNVVGAITPEFLATETKRSQRRQGGEMAAWELVMRGRWHLNQFSRQDTDEARRVCMQAISTDPQNSLAYAVLSWTEFWRSLYGWSETPSEAMDAARDAARRAVNLDDRNSFSYAALSFMDLFSMRHDRAIENGQRAIELNPNEAYGFASLGVTYAYMHESENAMERLSRALQLSPRDIQVTIWLVHLGLAHYLEGRYREAADFANKGIDINPAHPSPYRLLAASCGALGLDVEARLAAEQLVKLSPTITISITAKHLPFKFAEDREHYLDGLRKARLPE